MTERVPLLRKVTQPNGQTSELTIEQALRDTNLLGAALGNLHSWSSWLTVLKAAFGQELTEQELTTFQQSQVNVLFRHHASENYGPSLVDAAARAAKLSGRRRRQIARKAARMRWSAPKLIEVTARP